MSRKFFIAASLFAAFAANAAQNDPEQQRYVLDMEGVGQVLPTTAAVKAKPAAVAVATRTASGLNTAPTLQISSSRAAVIAEISRARAAGEMDFMHEEIGNFQLPQTTTTGETRLARLFKR